MPRERVHWEVLQRATLQAKAAGAVRIPEIIFQHANLARLGAVAHDAPYYFRGGADSFEKVGAGLHGLSQSDTFYPLRIVATEIVQDKDPIFRSKAWAFLLGMYSHAIADQFFHPWVFYFTGDYYHPDPHERSLARARHRLIEVYLDAWMKEHAESSLSPSILLLLRGVSSSDLKMIAKWLGAVLTENFFDSALSFHDRSVAWRQSFWHMGYIQLAAFNPLVGAVLRAIASTGWAKILEIDSLSAWRRDCFGKSFEGAFEYRNPASGVVLVARLQEILDGAVAECARLFISLDQDIDSESLPAVLKAIRGVSLNYGVWGVGPGEARYYSDIGVGVTGLQISR